VRTAIKTYRQFAQKELKKNGLNITVDQWLVLKSLSDYPGVSQKELAEMVFKDAASITRIIALLEKAGFIKRTIHNGDHRRTSLSITPNGNRMIRNAETVVKQYRAKALRNISQKDIRQMNIVLNQLISNSK
jgi:DNA-binding MarR family transcriptional regulator